MKLKDSASRLIAPLLCAVLLFSGCKAQATSRPVIMAAPPATVLPASSLPEDAPPPEDEPIELATVCEALGGSFAGSEKGAYNIVTYTDGSANLHYFDYEAMEMRVLVAEQPQEQLYGRFANAWGGISPVYAGGALFLFRLGGPSEVAAHGSGAAAAIIRMQPDGSAPLATSFSDSYAFCLSSGVLYDGASLYFLMWDEGGAETVQVLMRLDTATMEAYEVHRLSAEWEYAIQGYWEKGPTLYAGQPLPEKDDPAFSEAWQNRSYELQCLGMQSGTTQTVARWQQNDPNCMHGSIYYYWSEDEAALKQLDVDSGEFTTIAQGFQPSDYSYVYLQQPMTDGTLCIQFTYAGGARNKYYTIRCATGEVFEAPTANLGQNVLVCAEREDAFLVRHSDKWINRENIHPAKIPGGDYGSVILDKFVSVPEYALIAKADYWAGNPSFVPFNDLVYS